MKGETQYVSAEASTIEKPFILKIPRASAWSLPHGIGKGHFIMQLLCQHSFKHNRYEYILLGDSKALTARKSVDCTSP